MRIGLSQGLVSGDSAADGDWSHPRLAVERPLHNSICSDDVLTREPAVNRPYLNPRIFSATPTPNTSIGSQDHRLVSIEAQIIPAKSQDKISKELQKKKYRSAAEIIRRTA